MSTFMKKIFRSSILTSLSLFILGVLLLVASEATIISISYIIGSIFVLLGVFGIIRYIRTFNSSDRNELDLIYGIVTVMLGLLVISNPKAIAGIIPFILGIIIIISSAAKLHYAFQLKSDQNDLWKSTLIISILTTICGIILLFNPFAGAVVITKLVGSIIVVYSVLDIISSITIRNNVVKIHREIENIVNGNVTAEAEVVSEKDEEEKETKSVKKNKKKKSGKKNDK